MYFFAFSPCGENTLKNVCAWKVLIDLAKDDSIYYCGIVLGGTNEDVTTLARTRSTDQQVKGTVTTARLTGPSA